METFKLLKILLTLAQSSIQMETATKKSRESWFSERPPMEESGKVIKSTDVSLETKGKIIHILLFPITMYGWESWTVKKADRERWIHLKFGWRRAPWRPWTTRKTNEWVLEQMNPEPLWRQNWANWSCPTTGTSWEGRVLRERQWCWVNRRRQERGRQTMRWTDTYRNHRPEAAGAEQGCEDRTRWVSLIRRVTGAQSRLSNMEHTHNVGNI